EVSALLDVAVQLRAVVIFCYNSVLPGPADLTAEKSAFEFVIVTYGNSHLYNLVLCIWFTTIYYIPVRKRRPQHDIPFHGVLSHIFPSVPPFLPPPGFFG